MKKKDKKKVQKKGRVRLQVSREIHPDNQDHEQRIIRLEKEVKQHVSTINALTRQLKDNHARKSKKSKSAASALNAMFAQQKTRVGIDQKRAWKRHSYLRDRYEFHLSTGQGITNARNLAGQDLRMEFGKDAGYTEQELEQILS